MIAAGQLRHRVVIEVQVPVRDFLTGAQLIRWQPLAIVWARITPLSARELVAGQAIDSKVTARVVIRWRPDVTAKCRLVHGGRIYNIEGVLADPVSGREYLTLPVSAGVNEG